MAALPHNDRCMQSSQFPASLTLILCLTLLAAACSDNDDSPTSPTPAATPSYTALGASDAIGFGGSVVCAPFYLTCNGTGYVQQIIRRFREERGEVGYLNVGVPGQVLSPAIDGLAVQAGRSAPGNFLERQAPAVLRGSTHVTIFAGGNDANVIAQAVRAGLGGTDVRGYIDQQVRQWGTDYEGLVARIRERAPDSRIVVLNLPNLAAAPYLAGNSTQERSVMQRIAVGLADRANALTARGVVVVDLLCEPRSYEPANFSADGFHPSDRGYNLIASLAYPALVAGASAPPSASCPQRALFPAF